MWKCKVARICSSENYPEMIHRIVDCSNLFYLQAWSIWRKMFHTFLLEFIVTVVYIFMLWQFLKALSFFYHSFTAFSVCRLILGVMCCIFAEFPNCTTCWSTWFITYLCVLHFPIYSISNSASGCPFHPQMLSVDPVIRSGAMNKKADDCQN